MIDLSIANSGGFGKGDWFSELYRAAVNSSFTGGILIEAGGSRAIFFDVGKPVHAGGAGYTRHFLGELMVAADLCTQSQLMEAVQKQQGMQQRPLLGSILVADAGVDPNAIKRLLREQTRLRLAELFALSEGTWKSAPGRDGRISDIGVPCDPWSLLLGGLESASDGELRAISDETLGKAVQLDIDTRKLERLQLDPASKKLLKYMEKPRKPDQLERALKNRRKVRALLRLLQMESGLKLRPQAKAIPIPKATLLKGIVFDTIPRADSKPEPEPEPIEKAPEPPKPKPLPPIAKEVKVFHATMKDKTYFDLLDVLQHKPIDAADLRKKFTTIAKKFHPDAFPTDVPEEIQTLAREVSAYVNEAYQTISDDRLRAEYVAMLSDDRIKGDARKAELIRDAETKAQMGVVMIRKKEFQKAREFFKFAMEADPSQASYKTNFVWAMFSDADFDRNKSIEKGYEIMKQALEARDVNAQTHYVMGQLLKAMDRMKEAENHFKRAVRLDRKHADATRELRLIKMREDKKDGDKKGGAFSKLFKR